MVTVTYTIISTAEEVHVSTVDEGGEWQQTVTPPWKRTVEVPRGTTTTISAEYNGSEERLECRIVINDLPSTMVLTSGTSSMVECESRADYDPNVDAARLPALAGSSR